MSNQKPSIDRAEIQEKRLAEIRSATPVLKKVGNLEILVEPNVYSVGTDSYLCARNISIRRGGRGLDIGTGTGVLALTLAVGGAGEVTGVDVNDFAIENAMKNKERTGFENVNFKRGDMFQQAEGQYDTIVYNPPYRDAEPKDQVDACFYDPGHKSVKRFFAGLKTFLKPEGVAYLAWSNIGPMNLLPGLAMQHGLSIKLLGSDFGRNGYEFYVYSLRL